MFRVSTDPSPPPPPRHALGLHCCASRQPLSDVQDDAIQVARDHADHLLLAEHFGKRAEVLSGGTQRKTNVALALLAGHRVLLLDEPSTGMVNEDIIAMLSCSTSLYYYYD